MNPSVSFRYGVWYSDDTAEVLPTCKPIVCNHPVIPNGALETGESVRYRSCETVLEYLEGWAKNWLQVTRIFPAS